MRHPSFYSLPIDADQSETRNWRGGAVFRAVIRILESGKGRPRALPLELQLLLLIAVIAQPAADDSRRRRIRVLFQLFLSENVEHRSPADLQIIGDERTVTAPPHRLRAHDRGAALR